MGDMWDEYKADCYWQPLPPRNVDEARSGEHKSIFVNVDHMADKMTWTVEKGELSEFVGGPFDRLDDAKACADEALEMAYAEYPVEIVKDEGLDPDEWAFVDQDDLPHFQSKADPAVSIQRHSKAWHAFVDDEPSETGHPSVAAAVAAWAATRSPSP